MIVNYQMFYDGWRETVTVNSEEHNRAKFKFYLEPHLSALQSEFEENRFKPRDFRLKTIREPKLRIAQVPAIRDKVVQHAICDNYVYDKCTAPLIRETGACMKNRGDSYDSEILKHQLRSYYKEHGNHFYVLKCDIHHYFASIPHRKLIRLLERHITDKQVLDVMIKFIELSPGDVGVALGLQQSQLTANLYLSSMDHKCKEQLGAKRYGRHMDDFYIISHDRKYLEKRLEEIEAIVHELGLELNPKTAILEDKFDYLGFEYRLTETGKVIMRLSNKKRNAKRKHLKRMLRELEAGEITIQQFAESYQGWRAHALVGDTKKLVFTWDNWLIEEVGKMGYGLIITDSKKRKKWRVIGYVKNDRSNA